MEETGIDLVVYGSCQNFQYLTGLLVDWRHGVDLGSEVNTVFVPWKGEPILTLDEASSGQTTGTWIKDIRVLKKGEDYGKLIEKVISDLDMKGRKVGLGDHLRGSTTVEVLKAVGGNDFCKAEGLMDHLRMIKDEGEIERLRKAAKLTNQVMEAMIDRSTST